MAKKAYIVDATHYSGAVGVYTNIKLALNKVDLLIIDNDIDISSVRIITDELIKDQHVTKKLPLTYGNICKVLRGNVSVHIESDADTETAFHITEYELNK